MENTNSEQNPLCTISIVGRSFYSFRAWNKESKKMMEWQDIKRFGNLTKLISLNHIVIMQDVNFEGLYEGDIIEDNVGVGVVVYSKIRHTHLIRYKNTNLIKDFFSFLDSEKKGIIKLGNIFENGDVL